MKSPPIDITQDPRWASIVARDKAADGAFWYSVATTGVFCRPSCPSRLANPKNVRLHDSIAAAQAAGFRACRRCNPGGISIEEANNAIVAKACKLIDEAGETLSLAQVAESVELSPHYFHRLFKKATGLTPKAYAVAGRSARLRARLTKAATVTAAFHEAGFGSNGRFYEASAAVLGMSPSHYRAGGVQEVLRFAVGQCSLGARSRPARRRRTRASPRRSARRDPCVPWPEPVRRTPTRSPSRATASSGTTVASRATAGGWNASASSSSASRVHRSGRREARRLDRSGRERAGAAPRRIGAGGRPRGAGLVAAERSPHVCAMRRTRFPVRS